MWELISAGGPAMWPIFTSGATVAAAGLGATRLGLGGAGALVGGALAAGVAGGGGVGREHAARALMSASRARALRGWVIASPPSGVIIEIPTEGWIANGVGGF